MSNEKISIQDLVDAISKRTGSSKKKADDFVRVFQDTIEDALMKDGLVKIKGFGTFKLVWNEARKSVNVQSGQEYIIPGHNKVSFVPEAGVKDIINERMTQPGKSASKQDVNPLEKLNEQAEEIKLLISELEGLKPEETEVVEPIPLMEVPVSASVIEAPVAEAIKPEIEPEQVEVAAETIIEEPITIEEPTIIEQIPVEAIVEKPLVVDDIIPVVTEAVNTTVEPKQEETKPVHFAAEIVANELSSGSVQTAEHHAPADYKIHERDIPVKKKKKAWIFILLAFLLLAAGAFLYLSYIQVINFNMYKAVSSVEVIFTQKEEKTVSQKITAKPKPKTLVLPADTVKKDTVKPEEKSTQKVEEAAKVAESAKSVVVVKPQVSKQAAVVKPAPVIKPTSQEAKKSALKETNIKVGVTNKAGNVQSTDSNQKAGKVSSVNSEKMTGSIFEQPRVYNVFIATITIKKGSHLTLIAEKYYGHRNFWVFIYEANKDKISNPNALPVGFKVKIPLLNPALVDASNPECIEYGRRLEVKYVNEFKAKK